MEPQSTSIEVTSFFQIPSFHIVGLPCAEVLESRERVRAALDSSAFEFPKRRVVVNLAPSGIKKGGTWLDLPLALAILAEGEEAPREAPDVRGFACGELGLYGEVRGSGLLLRAWSAAWREGASFLLCPREEAPREAACRSLLERAKPYPGPLPRVRFVATLREAWEWVQAEHWKTEEGAPPPTPQEEEKEEEEELFPLTGLFERTLLAALLGGHSFLWLGPKGIGKTHAFRWARALQPEGEPRVQLEQAWLQELSEGKWKKRVIREVGTQVKPAALLGSLGPGGELRVGELGLAHGGILLADEFPEWPRDARECLRHPLESGIIRISRAQGKRTVPARVQLLANGNLCPCGGFGGAEERLRRCRCSESVRRAYLSRLSGPVLDRLDGVARLSLPSRAPLAPKRGTTGEIRLRLRERIDRARARAVLRYGEVPSRLPLREVQRWLGPEAERLANLRSRHRAGRFALSLALLDGSIEPRACHLAEAVSLRPEHQGFGD